VGAGGQRAGSHNLVVGQQHRYSSFGGLVAGEGNSVSGPAASVSGGFGNVASNRYASVSGGQANTASGEASSISGGHANTASDNWTSVGGGQNNSASSNWASISGGQGNTASGLDALVPYVKVLQGEIEQLKGPHIIIEGANVHIRSGSNRTYEDEPRSGLGNLIIGYNGLNPTPVLPEFPNVRTGSHNLVIGEWHSYSHSGGLVAGLANRIEDHFATVIGGQTNQASAPGASRSLT
jgi:hypothetical protein